MFEKLTDDLWEQLTQLKKEFDKYKLDNNIETVFGNGFDLDTRAKLLSGIKDLMVESDWHKIDKEAVEKVSFREQLT